MARESGVRIRLSPCRVQPDAAELRLSVTSWVETQEIAMPKCEVCGNDYDKAFQVIQEGETRPRYSRQ